MGKLSVIKLELHRPVAIKHPITSGFGKIRIINGEANIHKGIDFGCPEGTEVRCMADGVVFKTGWEVQPDNDPFYKKKGLGLRVWQEFIFNGKTYYGWYGHLSQVFVDDGFPLAVGDLIGLSGNTGRSTGPHLHVQFREKNTGTYFDAEFH